MVPREVCTERSEKKPLPEGNAERTEVSRGQESAPLIQPDMEGKGQCRAGPLR